MYRLEIQGTVYYSGQYKRVKKRNSYTIVYVDKRRSKTIAFIEYFVFIHQKVIAILKPLLPMHVHVSCKEHFVPMHMHSRMKFAHSLLRLDGTGSADV